MDNAIVIQQQQLTAGDIRSNVNLVQEVMKSVMKKDTHYGTIPGCKQPSLYKAGSEVLLTTFRIAVSLRVDDLSTEGEIRYRVFATGTHQLSGIVLGEGVGECSTGEEKYKWRRAICPEEFDDTPENQRRIKYSKYNNKVDKVQQVKTQPADFANTILKMAKKRAQIDLTLTATAASDIFTQDIEDLPEELRERDEARKTGGVAAGEAATFTPTPEQLEQAAKIVKELEAARVTQGKDVFRTAWKALTDEHKSLVGIPERDRIDAMEALT